MKPVRAAGRALDILLSFSAQVPERSVAELAKELGLPRPTVYRLLYTLEQKRLVRPVGTSSRYRLDSGVMRPAHVWLANIDVVRIAEPYAYALREQTDETAAVYVPLGQGRRICVIEQRSRQPLSYSRGVGYTAPLNEGASGKAILAFWPDGARTAFLGSITQKPRREALRRELARIARAGVVISKGELIVGAVAIAAPIFGAGSEVLGSICLFGPEARLTGRLQDRCLRFVRQAAQEVSAALGGGPDASVP